METYLSPKEAADLIPGMTVANLAQRRFQGTGPKYLKPGGGRVIVYREADVIAWLESSERTSTAAVTR